MIEVIYGTCEVDLFDGPTPRTRTYQADGHWLTGVDSHDCESFCDEQCAEGALRGMGFAEAPDEPGTWWIRDGSPNGYADATLYPDTEPVDDQAPYVCAACNATLYDLPDDYEA